MAHRTIRHAFLSSFTFTDKKRDVLRCVKTLRLPYDILTIISRHMQGFHKITEVRLGHMKNALVGVLLLQCIQHQRVHSSNNTNECILHMTWSYEKCTRWCCIQCNNKTPTSATPPSLAPVKMAMQNLQDCRKTKRYVVQFLHCIRAAIVRFSAVVARFAAFLRQPCNKAHGYLALVLCVLHPLEIAPKSQRK